MASLLDELDDISCTAFIDRIGCKSLEEAIQNLPSARTTDAHILAGEKYLNEANAAVSCERQRLQWEAFHQFSQTHSTLFHHRRQQRQLRQIRSSQKNKKSKISDTKEHLLNQCDGSLLKAATTAEQTKAMIEALPANWTVVHITAGVGSSDVDAIKSRLVQQNPSKHTIHISRVSCGPDPCLIMQTLSGCDGLLLDEMERIKEQNKVLNKAYADNVVQYCAMREQLDARLKRVVAGLESAWLRGWRCLLSGSPVHASSVRRAVEQAAQRAQMHLSSEQVEMILLAVCSCSVQLGPQDTSYRTIEGVSPLQLRSVVSLLLGLSVRDEAVQQLCAALQNSKHSELFSSVRKAPREHLLVILDKRFMSLPWECTSQLQEQPVSRMPSLQSLYLLYENKQNSPLLKCGIDCSSGFYLLDPDNNLPRTQSRLSDALEATLWQGVKGVRPTHEQFKQALAQKDVFMYVGHGSGSQYLPGETIEELDCRACALLYGCSSVRLLPRGYVPDPWGVLLNYFLANCPCVVGMLWEVTDRDSDLLTNLMLESMQAAVKGELKPPADLPSIIARSRDRCNRYMTATAIVVYGLPCWLKVEKKS